MSRLLIKIAPSAVLLLYSLPAFAITAEQTGLKETAEKAFGTGAQPTDITVVIGRIISAALGLLGIIFLVLIVYGGFIWMIGGREGKENEINKAKGILRSAIIGLLIVSAAYAITDFVINSLITATGPEAAE